MIKGKERKTISLNGATKPEYKNTDLEINGHQINFHDVSIDRFSVHIPKKSAITIAAAINNSTHHHDVTASINFNELNLGTFYPGKLKEGDFSINECSIQGNFQSVEELALEINDVSHYNGVLAKVEDNNLVLISYDGRNISAETQGSSDCEANFSNFSLCQGGQTQVQLASIDLRTFNGTKIEIGGNCPEEFGFSATPKKAMLFSKDVANSEEQKSINNKLKI